MAFKKGNKAWNSGLTKETDERVRRIAEKIAKTNAKKRKGGKNRR